MARTKFPDRDESALRAQGLKSVNVHVLFTPVVRPALAGANNNSPQGG